MPKLTAKPIQFDVFVNGPRPHGRLERDSNPVVIMPARDMRDAARSQYNSQKKERVAETSKLIRTCKIMWVENSSHSVILEHPDMIGTALQTDVDAGFFEPDAKTEGSA